MADPHAGSGPDDHGAADTALRERMVAAGAAALRGAPDARLLIAVIPDAQASTDGPPHMAAATMVSATGQHGLLAFTGLDSLRSWSPDARPMPITVQAAARLALVNDCAALVVDVLGPRRVAITGADLTSLGQEYYGAT